MASTNALLLDGITALSYNGVSFSHFMGTRVSFTPELDPAKRTTKWTQIDIHVSGYVTADNAGESSDSILLGMRQKLERNGGVLKLSGRGYGDIEVNTVGGPSDCKYGPQCKIEDCQPRGGAPLVGVVTMYVTWSCTTWYPQCPDALTENRLASVCFGNTHTQDEDGYSQLTTNITAEIPATRLGVSDPSVPDHIDRYVDRLYANVPLGFQRGDMRKQYSLDKRIVEISWTDKQLRAPPLLGCTRTHLKHRMEASGPAYVTWNHSISGTITVPPNVSKEWGFLLALSAARQRELLVQAQAQADFAQNAPRIGQVRPAGNGGVEADVPWWLLLGGFHAGIPSVASDQQQQQPQQNVRITRPIIEKQFVIENDATSRDFSFTLRWFTVLARRLDLIVRESGMWQPLTRTTFEQWRTSMKQQRVFDVRGPSHIVYNASDDALVDLCVSDIGPGHHTRPVTPVPKANRPDFDPVSARPRGGQVGSAEGSDADLPSLANPFSIPNPEATWLEWSNRLVYHESRGRFALHQPLAGTLKETGGPDAAGVASGIRSYSKPQSPASVTTNAPGTLQECGTPPAIIYMVGHAVRIGLPPPAPRLLRAKGCLLKLNRTIQDEPRVIQKWGDIPVIRNDWLLEYVTDQPPTKPLPRLADPVLGFNGQT